MAITTAQVGVAVSTTTYTSSGDNAVTFMSLCNYSGGDVVVDIHVVPSGGAVDNTTLVITTLTIATLDTYILYHGNEKIVLEDLGTIVVVPAVSGTDVITVITSYVGV